MSVVEFLSQPLWQRLGLTLVHFLWQGLAVAVLAGAFVRVFRLKHGNARYGAYLLAFIAMIVCPVVTFTAIDIPISPNTELVIGAESTEVIETSSYTALSAGDILAETETSSPAMPTLADSIPLGQRISDWLNVSMPWVLVIWMVGVIVLSVRLLMGFVGVYRWRHHLEPLPERLAQRIASLSDGLGMRGFSCVFISPAVLQAIAVGYLRPMVLLPAAMVTQMQPEMLEAVIAHELAHIRRLDLWVNLAQRVTETLLFYHPAVWWLSNCLRGERELCCDELAVKATGRRLTYATTLESVGRARFKAKQPVLAAGLGQDNKPTLGRVRHILGLRPTQRNCPFWLAGVIAVLFLAAIAIPTTLALTERTEKVDETSSESAHAPLSDLPEEVRAEIEKLWSTDTRKRASAVMRLRSMGMRGKADAAVPYLADMLGDDSKYPEMVLMASSLSSLTQSCSPKYTFGSEAAETIARIGKKSDKLLALLESDDWKVRADATRAIGGLKDSRAADMLIAFVRDKNEHPYVRGNAALAIALLKDDRAVAPLIGASNDDEAVVRKSAASALGDLGGPQAAEPLMALLADSDPQVRIAAAGALGGIKESDVIPALLKALGDEHRQVREVAAGALSRQPDRRSLEPLIEALGDSYPNTRARAAQALGELKDSRVFEPLIAALKDDNEYVRWHAATALGVLKDSRAVEPLIAVAMNDEHIARIRAIGALGKLGGSRAIDTLIDILKDDDTVIKRNARDALRKITGKKYGPEYETWKSWWDKNKTDYVKSKKEKPKDLESVVVEGIRANRDKFKCGYLAWSSKQFNDRDYKGHPAAELAGQYELWWDGKKMATKYVRDQVYKDPEGNFRVEKQQGGNSYDGGVLSRKPDFRSGNWLGPRNTRWRGLGSQDWMILRESNMENIRKDWSVVDTNGVKLIRAITKNTNETDRDYGGYSIRDYDPSKGYGLVNEEWYNPNGSQRLKHTVKLQEVIPGGWFPVEVDFKSFAITDGKVYSHQNYALDIERCSFNDKSALPDRVFKGAIDKQLKYQEKLQKYLAMELEGISHVKEIDKADKVKLGAREAIEKFVAAAMAGDFETGRQFADPEKAPYDQIEELHEVAKGQNLWIMAVVADDFDAIAVSSVIQGDHERIGPLVFFLDREPQDGRDNWWVDDIDMETPDSAEVELKQFLEKHPKAQKVPYENKPAVQVDNKISKVQKSSPPPATEDKTRIDIRRKNIELKARLNDEIYFITRDGVKLRTSRNDLSQGKTQLRPDIGAFDPATTSLLIREPSVIEIVPFELTFKDIPIIDR